MMFNLHRIAQKLSFPLRISSVKVTKSAGFVDLVTFTEEILNGKFHFMCSTSAVFNKRRITQYLYTRLLYNIQIRN